MPAGRFQAPVVRIVYRPLTPAVVDTTDVTVVAPCATATADASAPLILEVVFATLAAATAAASPALFGDVVLPPQATASASANPPVLLIPDVTLVAAPATATAAASPPLILEVVAGTVASASATAGDQYTVLLLHADGADASTLFPDSSAAIHSVTAYGNAQVDTAQSKFGGGSVLVAGSGDRLAVADHADFKFGTDDFTIDLWVNLNTTDGGSICAKRVSTLYGPFTIFQSYGTSDVDLFMSSTGAGWDIVPGTSIASGVTLGTWHHVALTRTGTTIRAFWDGVQSLSASTAASLFDNATDLTFGAAADGGESFNGQIDEIRVTKDASLWEANFTPPAAPFASFNYPVVREAVLSAAASASAAAQVVLIRETVLGVVGAATAGASAPVFGESVVGVKAAATAAAFPPLFGEVVFSTVAAASAVAFPPVLVVGGNITIVAPAATATAAAPSSFFAETAISVGAVATGAAQPPLPQEVVFATLAAASCQAFTASFPSSGTLLAAVATATATAYPPTVSGLALVLTPVVCDTLTLTTVTCGVFTLSASVDGVLTMFVGSDVVLVLAAASDSTATLTSSVDDSLILTGAADG